MTVSRLATTIKSEAKSVVDLWVRLGLTALVYGVIASIVLSIFPKLAPLLIALALVAAVAVSISVVAPGALSSLWNRLSRFRAAAPQMIPGVVAEAQLASMAVELKALRQRTDDLGARLWPTLEGTSQRVSQLIETDVSTLHEVTAKVEEIAAKLPELAGMISELGAALPPREILAAWASATTAVRAQAQPARFLANENLIYIEAWEGGISVKPDPPSESKTVPH